MQRLQVQLVVTPAVLTQPRKNPTFDDVADFVREWARVPAKRQIEPETQFERDLGITGDDGSELLDAAQKKFGVDHSTRDLWLGSPTNISPNSEGTD